MLMASICALSGCFAKPVVVQAIDTNAIQAVQAEIKRQVGIYLRASIEPIKVVVNKQTVELSTIPDPFWCGTGLIAFNISSIKAELTVTNERITDRKVGLSIPVHTVTLGASLEDKSDITNTEVLDYNLWLLPAKLQHLKVERISDSELAAAPIARALIALRTAIILSATKKDFSFDPPKDRQQQPCFADFNLDKPAGDAGNTYKMALSIISDGSGGVSIDAGIITAGATSETKSTTGNSLTVSFVQGDLEQVQLAKDAVDTDCKYPQQNTTKCALARSALNDILSGKGVGEGIK